MFDQLVESRPQAPRRGLQMIVSIVVHTAIIAVSLQLTRAAAESLAKRPVETTMLLAHAPTPPAQRTAAASSAAVAPSPTLLALPPAPLVVPANIPPVQTGSSFDISRFDTRGAGHGSMFDNSSGETGGDTVKALTQLQVDDPVQYLDGPPPVYPPALRAVGVQGSVTLRYIVGTNGRAEDSIIVTRSTNRGFEASAVATIRLSRFQPAKIRGRAVRQIVEQVVRFSIGG